jgi:acetylornithine/succinyldiaminopimelate/putrescine aminotransferase
VTSPALDRAVSGYEAYERHVNPALGAFLRVSGRDLRLVRGQGSTLEDSEGRSYDDWIAGFGSANLGHNPEFLKDAIVRHLAADPPNLFVESLNPFAGDLAARLVALAGPEFGTVFFCNSGSEAVEAALKTAILATGRETIAYAEGGYHGTTLGALACMTPSPYRDGLERLLPDFIQVPFGDLAALEQALATERIAGFLVEPIQVEAGVRVASDDYLLGARDLARRHGSLLILDEVQTGMGRTGELFAFQHCGATPDILVLAKSLGGGLVPIGASVMGHGLWARAFPGYRHCEVLSATFGGNALACRVAGVALDRLSAPAFLETVRRRGADLLARLAAALEGSPLVERVSGRGLLGGIRLREVGHPWLRWENLGLPELAGCPMAGPLLVERLSRSGILAQVCGHDWSVLRVEPPLTVDEPACARFVEAVRAGVRWLEEQR